MCTCRHVVNNITCTCRFTCRYAPVRHVTLLCTNYRREGYVPSNYVRKVGQTMEGEEWFFPTLSRTRAEDILKEEVCVCVQSQK